MTRPQVFTARNTQKTPIMFIISPVFIWKKQDQSQYPGVMQGVRAEVNGRLGSQCLEKGTRAGVLGSRPWAMLCVYPTLIQSNFTPSKYYQC